MNSQMNNYDQAKSAIASQAINNQIMINQHVSKDAKLIWDHNVNPLKSMIGNCKPLRSSDNVLNSSTACQLKSKAIDHKVHQLASKLLTNPKLNKRISKKIHFWNEPLSSNNSSVSDINQSPQANQNPTKNKQVVKILKTILANTSAVNELINKRHNK